MGLDLRESRRSEWQPDPLRRQGHPARPSAAWRLTTKRPLLSSQVAHLRQAHGAHDPSKCVGAEPARPASRSRASAGPTSAARATVPTRSPAARRRLGPATRRLEHAVPRHLFAFEWVQTRSPGGAIQWIPADGQAANMVPDAHDPMKRHAPIMFTTDLALKFDPSYSKIGETLSGNPRVPAAPSRRPGSS